MRFCGKITVLSSLETQFIFALEYSLEFWAKGTYSEVIYPRSKELHHEPEIKHVLCSFWSRIKTADLLYFHAQIKNQAGKSAASANTFIPKKKLFVMLLHLFIVPIHGWIVFQWMNKPQFVYLPAHGYWSLCPSYSIYFVILILELLFAVFSFVFSWSLS